MGIDISKDIDDMEYQGEEIKMGGKVRHIKYTIKGLKVIAKAYGSVITAFRALQKFNPEFDVEGLDEVTTLLYAGLIHEDSKITVDAVENYLNLSNITDTIEKITVAFNGSMATDDEAEDEDGTEPGETKA